MYGSILISISGKSKLTLYPLITCLVFLLKLIYFLAEIENLLIIFILLNFKDIISKAAENYSPSYLCNYLYKLVTSLMKFYEKNRCVEFGENGEILFIHENRISLIYISLILIDKLFDLIGLEQIDEI
jgi:arginyl-tRNA synthetase